MSIDLHLVSSPSTAGSLRWAIKDELLSGEVFCTMDIPELGPLANGIQRMKFLSNLGYKYSEEEIENFEKDAFKSWEVLQQRLKQNPVDRIVLWIDSTGSNYVFLRMACYWLKDEQIPIARTTVPVLNEIYSTAAFPPEVLAPLIENSIILNPSLRDQFTEEYKQIVARPELLRECDKNGQLLFKELSVHDHLLLENCPAIWVQASRVVGDAMGNCDPQNGLGDAFLSSRLEHLIVNGYIEADGPRTAIRLFKVRLRL